MIKKILSVLHNFIVAYLIVLGGIFGNQIKTKEKQADNNIESNK